MCIRDSYMFRALFMTFNGEFRGGAETEAAESEDAEELHLGHVSLHESPWTMVAPMVVLGILAVIAGFIFNPLMDLGIVPIHWFTHFMGEGSIAVEIPDFDIVLAVVSTVVAVAGIFLAYMMYYRQAWSAEAVGRRFSSIYTLLLSLIHI